MIEVAQGSPGSGKSAVACARGLKHIKRGGVVAANFSLVDGWAEVVVKNSILYKVAFVLSYFIALDLEGFVYKRASSMYRRWYRVDSLAAIKKIFPLDEAEGLYVNKGGFSEGEGLLLLDECQLVFNTRKWEKNFDWIVFFTQHRKLHWNVVLIAHDIQMIDSQIRPLAEYASVFRNLQKVKIPWVGIPVSPFPFFLVIVRYAGLGAGAGVVSERQWCPLPLWAAKLYDSLLVFCADDWGKDSDPHYCGPAPVDPVTIAESSVIRTSTLFGPHWDEYMQSLPGQTFHIHQPAFGSAVD